MQIKSIKARVKREEENLTAADLAKIKDLLLRTSVSGEEVITLRGKAIQYWYGIAHELQWRRTIMEMMLQELDGRPAADPADTLFEALRMTRYLLDSEKVADTDVRNAMDDLNVYLSDYLGKILLEERLKKEEE